MLIKLKVLINKTMKVWIDFSGRHYLMNGPTDEAAGMQLTDRELLQLFNAVQELNPEDKKLVITFLDAFVAKRKIQNILS